MIHLRQRPERRKGGGVQPVFFDDFDAQTEGTDITTALANIHQGTWGYLGTELPFARTDVARSGSQSIRFPYTSQGQAFEANMVFGSYVNELWMEFYFYVPTTFQMAPHPSGQMKFFQYWRDHYQGPDWRGGAEIWPFSVSDGYPGAAYLRAMSNVETTPIVGKLSSNVVSGATSIDLKECPATIPNGTVFSIVDDTRRAPDANGRYDAGIQPNTGSRTVTNGPYTPVDGIVTGMTFTPALTKDADANSVLAPNSPNGTLGPWGHGNLFINCGSDSAQGPYPGTWAITPGIWSQLRFHVKASSGPGVTDAIYKCWVDGSLYFSKTGYSNWNSCGSPTTTLHHMYLMGANDNAMPGYPTMQPFYIDDLKLYASDPGWG